MRKTFTPFLFIFLIVSLALYPLWQNKFYDSSDIRQVYIPLETFFQQEELRARIPAWHPDVAWGFPVIASAQIGFFYPPLLIGRLLPIWIYLPLLTFLHIAAGGYGIYFFARRLGLSTSASCLSAAAFALSQFISQHIAHLNIIFTAAWFPWQMIVAHRLATSRQMRARDGALFALVLGLPFLAGQIQIPFLAAGVSSAYFIYGRWSKGTSVPKTIGTICVVGIVAAAIAAVQLLPTYELLQFSSRGVERDFDIIRANQYSYPLYHLPSAFFPRFFGNNETYWGKRIELEYGFFIGTAPLILALWTFFQRKHVFQADKYPMRLTSLRFLKCLALISFLLALGSLSPFRLIGLEPSLWIFSAPARWLLFTTFALSLLAGFALDAAKLHPRSLLRFAKGSAVTLIATMLIGNAALAFVPADRLAATTVSLFNYARLVINPDAFAHPDAYYIEKIDTLIASLKATSISLRSAYTALPLILAVALPVLAIRRQGPTIIIAATSIELLILAATTLPTAPWSTILSAPETVRELPSDIKAKQARIFSVREEGETGAYLTNPASNDDAANRALTRQLLLPMTHAQFSIPGVEWPASLDLISHTKALEQLRGTQGYNIQDTKTARGFNIGAILSPASEEPTRVEVTSLNAAGRASLQKHDISLPYQEITPTHVRIVAAPTEPDTLIIRDTWFPGWQATVDGKPAPIQKSHDIFRSLQLPPGQHTIEMKYKPRNIHIGLLISLAASLVCCGILITGQLRNRKVVL